MTSAPAPAGAPTAVADAAAGEGRALTVTARVTGAVSAGPTGEVWFDALTATVTAGERRISAAVPVRVGVAAGETGSLEHADLGAGVSVQQRTYNGVTHEFFGMGRLVRGAYDAELYAVARLKSAFGL